MNEWQPIETAPKDGTAILAYWDCSLNGRIIDNDKCYAITRRKNSSWVNFEDDDDEYSEPTHWMPLPKRPADLG